MRRSRRAIAVAILQGVMKNASIADTFSVFSLKHTANGTNYFLRATEQVGTSGRSRYSSPPTRATTRRRRCAACQAAPSDVTDGMSREQIFAAGGAEKIAELLAAENPSGIFYNRVGAINRDLSVLMANVLAEERLQEKLAAGKKRKGRQAPPIPSRSSPAEGIAHSKAAKNRRRRGVRALLNWALERCSRRGWGGVEGDDGGAAAALFTRGHSSDALQEEQEEEEESGLVILDAFAASGVRALRWLLRSLPLFAVVHLKSRISVTGTTTICFVLYTSGRVYVVQLEVALWRPTLPETPHALSLHRWLISTVRTYRTPCSWMQPCYLCNRYMTEVPGVQRVVANDYDATAIKRAR